MPEFMQTVNMRASAPVTSPFLYNSYLPENPMEKSDNNDESIFSKKMPTKGQVEQYAYESIRNPYRGRRFDNLPSRERSLVEKWWKNAIERYEKTIPHDELTNEDLEFSNKCYSTDILA